MIKITRQINVAQKHIYELIFEKFKFQTAGTNAVLRHLLRSQCKRIPPLNMFCAPFFIPNFRSMLQFQIYKTASKIIEPIENQDPKRDNMSGILFSAKMSLRLPHKKHVRGHAHGGIKKYEIISCV